MEYYVGFLAGMLAALVACLAIIKYNEIKQEKEAARSDKTPVQFTVSNIRVVPITVELVLTREELRVLPEQTIERKIHEKLAEEVAKYADVITEDNPMSLTTKIRARVEVVAGRGGFR